ncbi:MAG: hypothetical protein ABI026_05560 [Gemmatimonadaceae bacterium]
MIALPLSVILTNARIRTGDPSHPWVTALGLKDGKLAVTGSAAELLKMAASDTTIIDANGRVLTLPPGVVVGSALAIDVATGNTVTLRAGEE